MNRYGRGGLLILPALSIEAQMPFVIAPGAFFRRSRLRPQASL